jgi:hypothetical protein
LFEKYSFQPGNWKDNAFQQTRNAFKCACSNSGLQRAWRSMPHTPGGYSKRPEKAPKKTGGAWRTCTQRICGVASSCAGGVPVGDAIRGARASRGHCPSCTGRGRKDEDGARICVPVPCSNTARGGRGPRPGQQYLPRHRKWVWQRGDGEHVGQWHRGQWHARGGRGPRPGQQYLPRHRKWVWERGDGEHVGQWHRGQWHQ